MEITDVHQQSGSSSYYAAVAETEHHFFQEETDADAATTITAAFGSSSYFCAVVDLAQTITTDADVVAEATESASIAFSAGFMARSFYAFSVHHHRFFVFREAFQVARTLYSFCIF